MNKKITLLLNLFLCSLIVSAQTFFSEDFSSGIPGTWSNIDNGPFNVIWRATTTGASNQNTPVNYQLNPVGTTAANGYIILDSDSAGANTNEDANLTTAPINCSGHQAVHLIFNEYFAQYGASTGIVKVSNDNINWVEVHHAETGLISDSGTANPYRKEIDISATAANQATVYVRFQYQGAWDYWWMVDDIQLTEPYPIDLSAMTIRKLNDSYTQIPLLQATTLKMSGVVTNTGLTSITGGNALYEIINTTTSATVFSETIPVPTINPGDQVTITPNGSFTPVIAGIHKARITVSAAGDANASNDVIESTDINISDSVYARDDGNFAGILPIGAGPGGDGAVGQNFLVHNNAALTSATIFLKDTLVQNFTGTPFYITVHPQAIDTLNPDGTTLIASTETLMISSTTIPPGGDYFTLHIQGGGVQLTPGLYFLAMHEVDSLLPFGYSQNIFSTNSTWVHYNGIPNPPAINDWARLEDFGFNPVYMLRANFGMMPDGVASLNGKADIKVYPNPSEGRVHISGLSGLEIKEIKVVDALGACILKAEPAKADQITLNLEWASRGLYTLILQSDHGPITRKIAIYN